MIQADIKIHNVVYECAQCGELKKAATEKPIAILRLSGIKPVEKKGEKGEIVNEYDMVYVTVFVDPDCFAELDLKDNEAEVITKN